jgi:hypothetical protein
MQNKTEAKYAHVSCDGPRVIYDLITKRRYTPDHYTPALHFFAIFPIIYSKDICCESSHRKKNATFLT